MNGSFNPSMFKSILQWNLNSFRKKQPRLEYIMGESNIEILALQETKNPINKEIKIRGYNIYKKDRNAMGGGVLLAIHKNIPSTEFTINTQLEVVVCTVLFKNQNINICSMYLPEHTHINIQMLDNLLGSIPDPKIVLGDLNAKHISWGSPINCARGKMITDCFLQNNLIILNTGIPTRYDKFTNQYSHIDVTACSLSLSSQLDWSVMDSTYTSDHFPISINFNFEQQYTTKSIKYKTEKADWPSYKINITLPNTFTNADLDLAKIVKTIIDVAKDYVPQSNPITNTKYSVMWWNDDCKVALDNSKKQFRKLKGNYNSENMRECNRLEELASLEILEAKRNSWQKYLGKVTNYTTFTEVWNVIRSLSGKKTSPKKYY